MSNPAAGALDRHPDPERPRVRPSRVVSARRIRTSWHTNNIDLEHPQWPGCADVL